MDNNTMTPIKQVIDALELAQRFIPESAYKESYDKCTDAITVLQSIQGRCEYCDGTGDVHRADGEWMGECTECTQPQSPAVGRVHILSIRNGNIWHTENYENLKLPKDFELMLYADAAMLSASQEGE